MKSKALQSKPLFPLTTKLLLLVFGPGLLVLFAFDIYRMAVNPSLMSVWNVFMTAIHLAIGGACSWVLFAVLTRT